MNLDENQSKNKISIETVFLKTSMKVLAPFILYTIPITSDISVLILVEVRFERKDIDPICEFYSGRIVSLVRI